MSGRGAPRTVLTGAIASSSSAMKDGVRPGLCKPGENWACPPLKQAGHPAHRAQALTHPVNQQGKAPRGRGAGKPLTIPAARGHAGAEPGNQGTSRWPGAPMAPAQPSPVKAGHAHPHRHPLWENRKRLCSGNRNQPKKNRRERRVGSSVFQEDSPGAGPG